MARVHLSLEGGDFSLTSFSSIFRRPPGLLSLPAPRSPASHLTPSGDARVARPPGLPLKDSHSVLYSQHLGFPVMVLGRCPIDPYPSPHTGCPFMRGVSYTTH